jgi:hypothetical protein
MTIVNAIACSTQHNMPQPISKSNWLNFYFLKDYKLRKRDSTNYLACIQPCRQEDRPTHISAMRKTANTFDSTNHQEITATQCTKSNGEETNKRAIVMSDMQVILHVECNPHKVLHASRLRNFILPHVASQQTDFKT